MRLALQKALSSDEGQSDTMVALNAQQLSVRSLAVSVRSPSAAQGHRCTLVVRSQKSQNAAERAAQQAVRYDNTDNNL